MKIKYFILTIIVLIAGSAATGYNRNHVKTAGNAKENVKQTIQDAKDARSDTLSDWQQFKIDAKVKINENEKKIDGFKADMKTAGKKVKAEYKKEVVRLDKQNNELKVKLNEYKYEGKDNWEKFKVGFNHDMDVVGKSISDFFSKKH
jgi:flagellar motility protein MotE (MotC chaperone)